MLSVLITCDGVLGGGEDGGESSKSIKSTSSLLWEATSAIDQGTRLLESMY